MSIVDSAYYNLVSLISVLVAEFEDQEREAQLAAMDVSALCSLSLENNASFFSHGIYSPRAHYRQMGK